MHWCFRFNGFKMLGLLSSGLPGSTISFVGTGFRLEEVEEALLVPGDEGVADSSHFFNNIFFISLSLAKLMGDFFVEFKREIIEFFATNNLTVSL